MHPKISLCVAHDAEWTDFHRARYDTFYVSTGDCVPAERSHRADLDRLDASRNQRAVPLRERRTYAVNITNKVTANPNQVIA